MQVDGQSIMNPLHYQVALEEAFNQLKLIGSRAQLLAVQLHESQQLAQSLAEQLEEERSKNVGTVSKPEDLQKGD